MGAKRTLHLRILTVSTALAAKFPPLRVVARSSLRGREHFSSESVENSSEFTGFSLESEDLFGGSLDNSLEFPPDYTIPAEAYEIPKTLTDAAARLNLKGCQSARARLNKLGTRFPPHLLCNGTKLTALGWELMQRLSSESLDDMWREFESTVQTSEPIEAEIVDEVGLAILGKTNQLLSTIEQSEIPRLTISPHFQAMLTHCQAVGSAVGQQMAFATIAAMDESYTATLEAAQLQAVQCQK